MDVMTILLIFLILNFSSQEQEVAPSKRIVLPPSTSERPVRLAVKVTISHEDISVEEQVVAKLARGAVRSADVGAGREIVPLLAVLKKEKARRSAQGRIDRPGDEDESEIVYLEAAQGIPYGLIDQAMKTAAAAGFTKFRLAVHNQG